MLYGLHPSKNLSVAWLETVHAELMKSSLVHTQYSDTATIWTLHGSMKDTCIHKLHCFNNAGIAEVIQ